MDLGWEDYLGQGVIIVEWAEKIQFDIDSIRVSFRMGEKDQRKIVISH
jgi:tRNA threonylcarbamoyladenosine biosynthesis protein TsaE